MPTKFLEEQVTLRISRTASEAIVARQLVEANSSDHAKCDQADAANDKCIGVAEISGAAGDEIPIACGGIIAVRAGGTIAVNDELVSDNTGKVTARGTTATVAYNVIGKALTAAASGELCMVAWGQYTVWGANAS